MRKHVFNTVITKALPKTSKWAWLFIASLLIGILACNTVFQMLIPIFQVALETSDKTGISGELSTAQFGLLIFIKNSIVALMCLLTARITFGIYPFVIVSFNGLFLGSVTAALVKYGDLQFWQVASGIVPHVGFEILGILLACAVGLMNIPLQRKLQSSTVIWGLLLFAATIEVTVSERLFTILT